MQKTLFLATLFGLLAATGLLADLGGEVSSAASVVNARIAEIDRTESPTKQERKEFRRLVKANRALEAYEGVDDKRDLKAVVKAIKQLVGARSQAPAVVGALSGLLDALADSARAALDTAVAEIGTGEKDKCLGKAQKLADRGESLLSTAIGVRPDNPKKAAKLMLKATLAARKAFDKAGRCIDKPSLEDVFMVGTTLTNSSDEEILVNDVEFVLSGTLGGQPLDYSGSAAEKRPGNFPIPVEADGHLDVGQIVLGIVLADPLLPDFQAGDSITGSLTIKTSVGDLKASM
ncbi:MAG: hypothetical protein ACYTDY_14545 [Planctomycetota bacterium]|jgi:hypothetical protein